MSDKFLIKGGIILPLIILLLVAGVVKSSADGVQTQSVGIVDLDSLKGYHPLTARINRLKARVEKKESNYVQEDRLADFEAQFLAHRQRFGEYSYDRAEFIIRNYQKQIERRELVAKQEVESLERSIELKLDSQLSQYRREEEEQLRKDIEQKEDYYSKEAKKYKEEVTKRYNPEIIRLELRMRLAYISDDLKEEKQARLNELKEEKQAEIRRINQDYEQKFKQYKTKRDEQFEEQIKDYQTELEEDYQHEYQLQLAEIKAAKEDDINKLESELEARLEAELLSLEDEISETDSSTDNIISSLKDKEDFKVKELERLKENLAEIKDRRDNELKDLINKYSQQQEIDLILSGKLPGVEVIDLTPYIKEELEFYR